MLYILVLVTHRHNILTIGTRISTCGLVLQRLFILATNVGNKCFVLQAHAQHYHQLSEKW